MVASAPGINNEGVVFLYVEPIDGWANMTQPTLLYPGPYGNHFGTSVAISSDGNTVFVGYLETGFNDGLGQVFVFVKPQGGWPSEMVATAELSASDGTANANLGTSISVSGNAVLAGAPGTSVGVNPNQGAAYLFVKPKTGWQTTTETAKLTASDGMAGDRFGTSVSLSGGSAVIGAINAPSTGSGKAYVFVKPSKGWKNMTQVAELTSSDGEVGDNFGSSVSISGSTILVGAPNATNGSGSTQGAAYVFVKPQTGWVNETETAKLTASDEAADDFFGTSVFLAGTVAAVGSPNATVGSNAEQGAAYLFVKPVKGWSATRTFASKLTASDGAPGDNFGSSLALVDKTVTSGAPQAAGGGAAYIFGQGGKLMPEQSTTITHVQEAQGASSVGAEAVSATFGSATSAGNLLVVSVVTSGDYVGVRPTSITDNAGNTYTFIGESGYEDGIYNEYCGCVAAWDEYLYYCQNAFANAGTVTANGVGGALGSAIFIHEYAGASTTAALDTYAAAATEQQQPPYTDPTLYITPTGAGELIYLLADTPTRPGSFTSLQNAGVAGPSPYGTDYYYESDILSSLSGTTTGTTANASIAAAFFPAPLIVTLSPPSLSFGPQVVGTTSTPQTVQISTNGSLSITSIMTSAEFTQTNNCGNSLPPGGSCQVSVTFTPSATGIQNGTLTISDSGTGSPQTAPLSGTGKALTTTTLVSAANPSVQGKSVTFTAGVSSLEGTPTGKVQFLNGTTVLATRSLTSGSAKYTTSKLPPGSNSITAVYEGNPNTSGSTSAPVNQIVMAVTTTTLRSSLNPSAYGQAVVFTAMVTSGIGAPPDGETVSFMKGTTVLGMGTLSDGSGSFTTSTLKVGTTSVTADYGGDSDFAGSKSKPVKQVVEK